MSHLQIPLSVLYAGLAGTVLALIVATISNGCSLRVFFLLALRLAIGWHFLFEGLHKVESYYTGPTDTNRRFTSEPYFKVAPGPLGEKMRKEFSDPDAEIAANVKAPEQISPADFAKLSVADQAAKCPPAVATQLDKLEENAQNTVKTAAEKALKSADETEAKANKDAADAETKGLKDAKTDDEKAKIKKTADAARAKAKAAADAARQAAQQQAATYEQGGKDLVIAAKAAYARWVYGVDARDCKVKGITGDVPLTAPQRIEHLAFLREKVEAAEKRETDGLGNGTGTDAKRVAEFRLDAVNAASDLARDAQSFIADLKKSLNGGETAKETPESTRGQLIDRVTMWFLVVVGSCLMGGLFTRLACVLATGFLVMTYLAHPPFPWYPLPPNTEGNPVFINKNVIEALALLVLACYPTGRWLGLDALVLRPFCKYKGECCTEPPASTSPSTRTR